MNQTRAPRYPQATIQEVMDGEQVTLYYNGEKRRWTAVCTLQSGQVLATKPRPKRVQATEDMENLLRLADRA